MSEISSPSDKKSKTSISSALRKQKIELFETGLIDPDYKVIKTKTGYQVRKRPKQLTSDEINSLSEIRSKIAEPKVLGMQNTPSYDNQRSLKTNEHDQRSSDMISYKALKEEMEKSMAEQLNTIKQYHSSLEEMKASHKSLVEKVNSFEIVEESDNDTVSSDEISNESSFNEESHHTQNEYLNRSLHSSNSADKQYLKQDDHKIGLAQWLLS